MSRDACVARRVALVLTVSVAGCLSPTDVAQGTYLGVPEGWSGTYDTQAGIGISTRSPHTGRAALYMSGQADPKARATLLQSILPDAYVGGRVRMSAWVKPDNVTADYSGIWMRVDGAFETLAFDNMVGRAVVGNGPWRQVSIVLDVPVNAVGITFGGLFDGRGALLLDDMQFELVDQSVPSTDLITGRGSADSSRAATSYATSRTSPSNLDFEGLPRATQESVDWLARTAIPLASVDPTIGLTDLAPFGPMIGSARLVGLGEGTHGTREFFTLKHRLIRYLVESQGFTQFAIEATTPEAEDINRYVLTGDGNPTLLLSKLRFWIWNTQEMLDMIRWMRQWNASAPADKRVQFHGIDIQQPGASMDSVEAFIARVDPLRSHYVRTRLSCFDPYASRGATFGLPMIIYAARLATSRAACAFGAKEVYDLLNSSAAAYKAASSPDVYATALHSARLVQQWEAMATVFSTNTYALGLSRDSSMAENVRWLRDRVGVNAKMVLWAHNDHIGKLSGVMGRHLKNAYGSDYVAVGFAFGSGVLNAVNGTGGSVQAIRPEAVPSSWIESTFLATGKPLLLLDTRLMSAGGAAAIALAGPISMRTIGSTFNLLYPSGFQRAYAFPADFDLLLFVSSAHESTLLPYVF